jgi:hypothetical protein
MSEVRQLASCGQVSGLLTDAKAYVFPSNSFQLTSNFDLSAHRQNFSSTSITPNKVWSWSITGIHYHEAPYQLIAVPFPVLLLLLLPFAAHIFSYFFFIFK